MSASGNRLRAWGGDRRLPTRPLPEFSAGQEAQGRRMVFEDKGISKTTAECDPDGRDHAPRAADLVSAETSVTPCFTHGTLIATPRGEMPAELLRAGDRVVTRDNGIQTIRWVGQNALSWRELQLMSHLRPVFIREGALGNGLPERDMMVSPNHRMLVSSTLTALHFDDPEVLVAAKHLVGGPGLREVESFGTTYIHFLFDRHEILLSNGCWSESFQPADRSLKGLGNSQRSEIYEVFPELKTEDPLKKFGPARRILSREEARLLQR
jgi:Hint domain